MTTIFECDGCGKQERMAKEFKPHDWYAKTIFEQEGSIGQSKGKAVRVVHACSRRCIEKTADKHKTHSLVLPV